VDIEVSPGNFERRDLELGVSDGINIEVKSGSDPETTIKQPQPESKDDKPRS